MTVSEVTALVSRPIDIVVKGLDPGEDATLTASTPDSNGLVWKASASFRADTKGVIDLIRAKPERGSYSIPDAMGLFWSMTPTGVGLLPVSLTPPSPVEVVTIALAAGTRPVIKKTVVRQWLAPGVIEYRKRTPADSFYGDYFAPPDVSTKKPAILMFGGSEGGLAAAVEAGQVASYGYPTLALAYFAEPGLPKTLTDIPLEYFVGALNWLRAQPGVDPAHIIVWGVSRGSEAALLLGADFPDLVHGVVALVPSAWVQCSLPSCNGSAWSLHRQPLPYLGGVSNDAEALIPAVRIHGPVFLDCGGRDVLWPSCLFVETIKRELPATDFHYSLTALEYPDGGHGVGSLLPFIPMRFIDNPVTPTERVLFRLQGKTSAANPIAREQAWPKMLSYLSAIATSGG